MASSQAVRAWLARVNAATPHRTRALVLCDADSYLKWGVSRALDLSAAADVEVVVVRSAVTPSRAQVRDAVAGRWPDVPLLSLDEVAARLEADAPDVLVLAVRGPLVELVQRTVVARLSKRPVTVSGIPGVWFPPTVRGVDFRRGCDVMVVHAHAEREALTTMVTAGTAVALASLARAADPVPARGDGAVVFAPQALVPRTRAERARLLEGIVAAAQAHPEVPFIIKVRGEEGEAQTHAEFASYPELAAARPGVLPRNLVFARGPLSDFLGGARALVTVSSTAALESIAADVPTLILDDFGIDEQQLNLVFAASGCTGPMARMVTLDFPRASERWRRSHYVHEPAEDDWVDVVLARVAASAPHPAFMPEPRGLRGVARRVRLRSQALGAADAPWRRALARVIVAPALAWRAVVVRR
ncbi:MAG: DUF6716 putative glycosyltransferase [Demequina sp.]|uniref:DUF6716 putative glycosyltransferase n=1 Tax=Demequina sp. TaxID=2050685 RepID=UPI003A87788B